MSNTYVQNHMILHKRIFAISQATNIYIVVLVGVLPVVLVFFVASFVATVVLVVVSVVVLVVAPSVVVLDVLLLVA